MIVDKSASVNVLEIPVPFELVKELPELPDVFFSAASAFASFEMEPVEIKPLDPVWSFPDVRFDLASNITIGPIDYTEPRDWLSLFNDMFKPVSWTPTEYDTVSDYYKRSVESAHDFGRWFFREYSSLASIPTIGAELKATPPVPSPRKKTQTRKAFVPHETGRPESVWLVRRPHSSLPRGSIREDIGSSTMDSHDLAA